MNIVIEEIVLNPLIQIEETVQEISIPISEMQVPGLNGKSAYQSALDGGFVGTELEFNDFLSQIGDVVDHITQTDNPHEVTKSQVGLPNVDNTSDADKPVSTATNTALGLKVDKETGKSLISDTDVTRLANTSGTNTGDQDLSSFATKANLDLKANIASPTFTGTVGGIDKTMVGLANVDNTSDADKPVSTATNTALGLKVDKVSGERLINATEITKLSNQSGTNTGDETAQTIINKIGDGSKINQSYLPSYVDDILEYDTVSLFPLVGELGKIYIVTTGTDINKQYRWTGSLYTQITNGLIASTNDVPEGINNLYFTVARFLANLTAANIKNALGITTLSGSNTGDQDLSDYVKNIVKETTQGANITGTVSETILYSKLIPANTFKDRDFMNIVLSRIGKSGANGTLDHRIRINTSNTLSGSLILAVNQLAAANQMGSITRIFSITNNFLIGLLPASALTDIINIIQAPRSYAFNPTIDNYIFITGQLSNSADTMYNLGTKITN